MLLENIPKILSSPVSQSLLPMFCCSSYRLKCIDLGGTQFPQSLSLKRFSILQCIHSYLLCKKKKKNLVVNVWLCSGVLSSVPFVVYVMDLMGLCNTI